MLVAEEEHECHRVVEFVHLLEVWHLIEITHVQYGKILDTVGDFCTLTVSEKGGAEWGS